MSSSEFGNDVEKAVKFITAKFAKPKRLDKPVLVHSFRVGMRLYDEGYDLPIVLAGFLHDTIEDSDTTDKEVSKLFGNRVAELVLANTKDPRIEDDSEQRLDALKRSVANSQEAAIIKSADLMDNHAHYSRIGNDAKRLRFEKSMNILLDLLPEEYDDKIFEQLAVVVKKQTRPT